MNKAKIKPTIFVHKWVDYTKKYGLGYILSNGVTGALFNDRSKAFTQDSHRFSIIEQESHLQISSQFSVTDKDLTDDFKRKIKLVNQFGKYLLDKDDCKQSKLKLEYDEKPYSEVHVKKWARRKHGTVFLLSNRVVHTIFKDGSELVIDQAQHVMLTVDQNGVKLDFTQK